MVSAPVSMFAEGILRAFPAPRQLYKNLLNVHSTAVREYYNVRKWNETSHKKKVVQDCSGRPETTNTSHTKLPRFTEGLERSYLPRCTVILCKVVDVRAANTHRDAEWCNAQNN